MWDWVTHWLNTPKPPRKTELQILLEHQQWHDERMFRVVESLTGSLDRVIANRFDRPQIADREPMPSMHQHFDANDLTDVLGAESDEEFFRKLDKITQ